MAPRLSTWDKLSIALVDDGSGNFTLNTTTIAGGAPVGVGTVLSAWDKLDRALTDDGSGGFTLQTTGGGGGGGAAAAGTLTGTTLAANVVTSSLTSVGVLVSPHMTGAVIDSGGLASTGNVTLTGVATSGGASLLTLTPGAHTNVTAEFHNIYNVGLTYTITGSYATERLVRFGIPTITAGSALTVTTAATVAVEGAPIVAGSALITRPLALWLQAGGLGLDGAGGLSTTTGPIFQATGTWITGGSATTTKPHVLIEPAGTSSGGWGAGGTGLGVNAAAGRIFDFQAAGVSILRADSSGISALSSFVITGVANANTLFVTQAVSTSGTRVAFSLNGGAHTGQAIAEEIDVQFNLSRTVTFTTGAGTVAALRAVRITPVTYAAGTAATTFTQAATFAVTGPPVAGTNVVFSLTPVAIWCAGALRLDTNVANGTTAALFTAASAPAAAQTAIQEWFVVYNNAGVARYIPSW